MGEAQMIQIFAALSLFLAHSVSAKEICKRIQKSSYQTCHSGGWSVVKKGEISMLAEWVDASANKKVLAKRNPENKDEYSYHETTTGEKGAQTEATFKINKTLLDECIRCEKLPLRDSKTNGIDTKSCGC
jgi:hypothetical protein